MLVLEVEVLGKGCCCRNVMMLLGPGVVPGGGEIASLPNNCFSSSKSKDAIVI